MDAFDPMATADLFGDFVAAMTGLRQQLIDAGWSPANAEEMVVEVYRKTTAS